VIDATVVNRIPSELRSAGMGYLTIPEDQKSEDERDEFYELDRIRIGTGSNEC